MSFVADLKKQIPNQETLAEHLWGKVIEGYCKDWDVIVELKEDLQCHKTGNVAMEISYKWEPSGIYSNYTLLVYKIGDVYWRCNRDKLIKFVEENPKAYRKIKWGDGWHSELILMTLFTFTHLFDILFKDNQ